MDGLSWPSLLSRSWPCTSHEQPSPALIPAISSEPSRVRTTHRSLLKDLHLQPATQAAQQHPRQHFYIFISAQAAQPTRQDGRQQQQRRPRTAGIRDVSHRPRLGAIRRTASCGGRGSFFFFRRRRRGSKCGSRRHSNADDYRGGNARRARGTDTTSIAGPEAERNLVRFIVYFFWKMGISRCGDGREKMRD